MLMSSGKRHIAVWRKQLRDFEEELLQYNLQYGQQYNPTLRSLVHPSVWATISEQLLLPKHRTQMGAPANHQAVEDYLRGIGEYRRVHGKPGEVYCADPLAVYRGLVWPDVTRLSYVTAFDIYMARWREFTRLYKRSTA